MLSRVLDNCQLVHPVHEGMTFLNNALEFTADAGNQFIPRKHVRGVHRHLSGMQKVGFDPIFPELGPADEFVILKFLDNP